MYIYIKSAEKRVGAHLALNLHDGRMCQCQRLHPHKAVLLSHEAINCHFALVVPIIDVLVIQSSLPKGTCYDMFDTPSHDPNIVDGVSSNHDILGCFGHPDLFGGIQIELVAPLTQFCQITPTL